MTETIVKINGVPTEIIAYNHEVDEGVRVNSGRKDVVIIITGNHGVPGFYKEFAAVIQSKLPKEVPIWIIGHAGHTKPPDDLIHDFPDFEKEKHLYDMSGNVQHKIDFIKKFVPQDAKIHIISHSIGSWINLKLLKESSSIANKVVKSYLLFPVIERVAETPNARFFTRTIYRLSTFIIFLSSFFALLPSLIQISIIRLVSLVYYIPSSLNNSIMKMYHPESLKRLDLIIAQSLKYVRERDDAVIAQHKDKLFLYYGVNDGWCPLDYYEDLKAKHPNIDACLCDQGFDHTFVLKDAIGVGNMVGDLINKSISSRKN